MESNESVEPVVIPQYIPAFTVARLSGGMSMEVSTNADETVISAQTQKSREELVKALRNSGYETSKK